jgi:hypothetical protein
VFGLFSALHCYCKCRQFLRNVFEVVFDRGAAGRCFGNDSQLPQRQTYEDREQVNRVEQAPETGSSVKVQGMNRFRDDNQNMIYFSLIPRYRANRRLVIAGVCQFTVLDWKHKKPQFNQINPEIRSTGFCNH